MLRAKLYIELETDCVVSDLTDRWEEAFPVSEQELIEDGLIRFVIDPGERRAEFERVLDESEEIVELERVGDTGLVVTKEPCGAMPIIRTNHGMLQGTDRVKGNQRIYDIAVFRREDLRAIVAELREIGSARVVRLMPYASETATLSSRQAEVVRAALEAGYYEWPREVDATELAAELDIAHSTLLEHLRKAERKLIEDALSRDADDGATPTERELMLDAEP